MISLFVRIHECYARNAVLRRELNKRPKMSWSLTAMRAPYKRPHQSFTVENLICREPIGQFAAWFEEAKNTPAIIEPNAMCLATCTRDGIPSARFVLLKEFGMEGFKFFTNYNSRKGEELTQNPRAALVFYWECLHRSVRIEGVCERLPEEESTVYFQSRPKESQIGSYLSNQSRPVESRAVLEKRQEEIRKRFEHTEFLPKPEEWGGFVLKPNAVEFWQGQSNRIHDRIKFRLPKEGDVPDNVILHLGDDGWVFEVLQP